MNRFTAADEPTGALDSKTSKQIMTLFREINDNTQTILMVTHSLSMRLMLNEYYLLKMDVCIMKFTREESQQISKSVSLIVWLF